MKSRLLVGKVWHERKRPHRYAFEHDVFYVGIDLAERSEALRRSRLLGGSRWSVLALLDADHFDGRDIRAAALDLAGYETGADVRVTMVTAPRVLGYVFNPVTFYLFHPEEKLARVLAEVHNTHGDRFVYRLENESTTGGWRSSAVKGFYVSPFIPLEGRYEFEVNESPGRLRIRIRESDDEGVLLDTGIDVKPRPLNDRSIGMALLRIPFVTLKTTALIHYHALKLWRRGVHRYDYVSSTDSRAIRRRKPARDRVRPEPGGD